MSEDIYEKLSKERKDLQASGDLPEWVSTQGWQLFKENYLYEAKGFKDTFRRMSRTIAKHMGDDALEWEEKFFNNSWRGWISNSSPTYNAGTDRGSVVSCSGQSVGDSIRSIFQNHAETAELSKNGFGTAQYLGNIRPRGAKITGGSVSTGIIPIIEAVVANTAYVSQPKRRGACAVYVPVDHGDFQELYEMILHNSDGLNVGWVFTDEFIDRLKNGDEEALDRWRKVLEARVLRGKGYIFKVDTTNRANPQMYKDLGLDVVSSQLCSEVMLHSSEEYTYTCVLASLNLYKYDEWKDTDLIFESMVYLDCIVSEFIDQANEILGLEKAVASTVKGRPVGLGVMGYSSYLQKNMIPFESFEAMQFNNIFFKKMQKECLRASQWLAERNGCPEWCEGYGQANTHFTAIAPTFSSSILLGGISQGIEIPPANVFLQDSAGGSMFRINPMFLDFIKERGMYSEELIGRLLDNNGSVQNEDWMTDHEKQVFKTAYEVDQVVVIRQASQRQRYICQGQSLNLFFSADAEEKYISHCHTVALLDEHLKSLYYLRSASGVKGSDGKSECLSCEG